MIMRPTLFAGVGHVVGVALSELEHELGGAGALLSVVVFVCACAAGVIIVNKVVRIQEGAGNCDRRL